MGVLIMRKDGKHSPDNRYEAKPTFVAHARFDIRPRRLLSREDAAFYIGVSPTTFDRLVADGRMPKSCQIYSRVLWDIRKLDMAADLISDPEEAINGREIEL
jgi:predicted DNA-binding transcriptional regulator AlpA